jgi:hypothetical protein
MRNLVIIGAVLLVAACVKHPTPVAPILSLEHTTCQPTPALAAALPITFNPEERTSINFDVDRGSPCLQKSGSQKQLYQLVALPRSATMYLVTVASQANGHGIFAPTLITFKEDGSEVRELSQSDFLFRGTNLSAKIEVQTEERYLMVASNPASVGESTTQINGLTHRQGSFYNGAAGVRFNTGREQQTDYKYSHAGKVMVSTQALPNRSVSRN